MLAAKYRHKFINIHPLADDDGRICHLILNAILLKQGRNLLCLLNLYDYRIQPAICRLAHRCILVAGEGWVQIYIYVSVVKVPCSISQPQTLGPRNAKKGIEP